MNSVRGWIQVLQKLEWKMFIVPRPQVVKETPKTDKRFEDTHGNKNDEPVPQPHPCSQNPDVRNGGSSTSQLVVSLNRNMYVDNPSDEIYNLFNYERESAQYPYVDIGSIGSGSSTERLVVDVRQHIDIENISDIANVPPYDNLSSSGIDKNYRKGRRRGFVAGVLLVVLCFLIAVAIALGLYFSKDTPDVTHTIPGTNETADPAITMGYMEHDMYESTVDLNVEVNETFQDDMSNNTSQEFMDFQERFCNNLEQKLTQEIAHVQSCEIKKLSKGSIIVESTLLIQSKKKISQKYLLHVLTEGNTYTNDTTSLDNNSTSLDNNSTSLDNNSTPLDNDSTSHLTRWGDLLIIKLEIISFVSGLVKMCAEGDIFDCSTESICRFFPLNNTYPSNCNMFQACFNNRGEKLQCPEGLEFAFIMSSDTAICKKPSNSTYCGLRRERDQTDRPTDPTDRPTDPTDRPTDPTDRPTDQPSNICTMKFPLFKNLPRIYDCPQDGMQHFIPTRNTYPNNCSNYTWCVNGHPYQYSTPNGTHFVYTSNVQYAPFDFSATVTTYCVQRQMYSECLKKNGLPDEEV